MRTTRVRVRLLEVEPVVLRVIDVPAAVLLGELHDLLQAAMGWTDSHLHQFEADGVLYGTADTDGPEDERPETGIGLRSLPPRFTYLYDLGDGWEHEIERLGPGGEQPGCVSGEGACPPEDVGGGYGYAAFLEAWADPDHPEHEKMSTWAGGWSEVQDRYPHWSLADRPASIEEDLWPLTALHHLLRGVGLLRLRHGLLQPTHADDDEVQIVRRLEDWLRAA